MTTTTSIKSASYAGQLVRYVGHEAAANFARMTDLELMEELLDVGYHIGQRADRPGEGYGSDVMARLCDDRRNLKLEMMRRLSR